MRTFRQTVSVWWFTCVSLVALSGLAYGGDFEGVIHSTMTFKDKTMQAKTSIKGAKMRMEMDAPGGPDEGTPDSGGVRSSIYDAETGTMTILMPAQKKAMEMSLRDTKEEAADPEKKRPAVVKTGKTETIAGYSAEQFVQKFDDGVVNETWASSKVGVSRGLIRGLLDLSKQRRSHDELRLYAEQGYFPLRMVSRGSDGSVRFQQEVTKIEKTSLSSGLFAVPTDYQTVNRSGRLGGRAPQGGMPGAKGNVDLEQRMREMRERKGAIGGAPTGPGGIDIEK